MAAHDAGVSLRELAARLIDEQVIGDAVDFDFGPVLLPDQQTPGLFVPGYMLILSCRSPVLSPPRIAAFDPLYDAYPAEALIRAAVTSCVTTLFEARAKLCQAGPFPGLN